MTTAAYRLAYGWAGFHPFVDHSSGRPITYGSFEVFYSAGSRADCDTRLIAPREGWYWHSCFPGCLPDGEPSGPYPTSEGAYLAALED